MKLLFKLVLLGILVVAVLPMIAPNSPLSGVIRAATADFMTFCDRRPDACEEGSLFAQQTMESLFALIGSIGASQGPSALTASDRALAPTQQRATAQPQADGPVMVQTQSFTTVQNQGDNNAQDRKAAFAGHGKSFSY
ncbi:hypothetical protein DLJ53_24310 [Acuticoccus sediminis]|uniref:Uncharacterized protein n=1 Tax=Acuticoccus sediminis TaxID=2184697 RepID=A0A8B2NPA7_9HYPH|nr:hypothetical protein [Acuticoccus sediminis]RAH98768.1 hypothetical protein DLJ53_24310 [Acuticoccus sediminis]